MFDRVKNEFGNLLLGFVLGAGLCALILLIATSRAEAQTDETRIYCIVHPFSVQHLQRCDQGPGNYLGCNQLAAKCDQQRGGQVFWSPEWNSWLEPFMGRREYCNVPTQHAYQRVIRFRFTNPEPGTAAAWTGVEALADAGALGCLEPFDPMAVPPALGASSGWQCCWHCDRTDPGGIPVEVYEGAYVELTYPAQSLNWPTNSELLEAAEFAFNYDPAWTTAYQEQVDALTALQGFPSNPYHYQIEAVGFAMKQRASIFWAAGTAKPVEVTNGTEALAWYGNQPEISSPWFALHQSCRYMVKRYVDNDIAWLQSNGWPTTETPALNACLDNVYARTDGFTDWANMFVDPDVAVQPTTWGAMKKEAKTWIPRKVLVK